MKKKILVLLVVLCLLIQMVPMNVMGAGDAGNGKKYVVQLIVDGLSDKMYDEIKACGAQTPNIDALINNGSRLRNVETVIPSYGGSQAAVLTGAGTKANNFLFRYYDTATRKVISNAYNMDAQTIFNKLKASNSGIGALASGWSVASKSLTGLNGFPANDSNYVLKDHALGDSLVSITDVAKDIVDAINSESTPQLLSGYSNDIKMAGWSNGASDSVLKATVEKIDTEIGKVVSALKAKGIDGQTTIFLNSLTCTTVGNAKVTTASLVKDINDNTGVKTEESAASAGTKAVVIKQYNLTYAQLYFTSDATAEDKQKVLNFLNTKGTATGDAIEKVVAPDSIGLSQKFGDYLICPVQGKSFSAAGTTAFRTDDLHNVDVFCVLSGANAPKRSTVSKENPSIIDMAPTICAILGAQQPDNCEGTAWTYQEIESKPSLTVASPKNNINVYKNTVDVVGIVDYPCDVKVNGISATLQDNKFTVPVTLTEGTNTITVTAENKFGKVTEERTVNDIVLPKMPEGNRVVYINWDGFANYYTQMALEQGRIPTLKKIIEQDGVYFPNAFTNMPSITDAMQPAIVSGTTPLNTDNYYRYFNKESNCTIQETPSRKNEAETIAESAVRQNLSVISINQFSLEDRGTTAGDQHCAYVSAPAGANGYEDAASRFDCAINMVKNLQAGGVALDEVPRFIALYMDDLDGIGHNEHDTYGVKTAASETQRLESVMSRLQLMDTKLAEFIQACKDAGIYDSMSFVLTTDHGMANFGQQESANEPSALSSLSDLVNTIQGLGDGYQCSLVLTNGESPAAGADIALVTVGMQVQISYINEFNSDVIAAKNEKIMQALQEKQYVDKIIGPAEIVARGDKEGFADLVISPKVPYSFKTGDAAQIRIARGQHDDLSDRAQRISAFMWGKNIKQGVTVQDTIHNTDFAATMSLLMGVNAPLDSTGTILYSALDGIEKPTEVKSTAAVTVSNSTAQLKSKAQATRIEVSYSCENSGKMILSINGKEIRDVFFPETNGTEKFSKKVINININQGDTITFTADEAHGGKLVNMKSIDFYGTEKLKPDAISIAGVPESVAYGDCFTVSVPRQNGILWSVKSGPAVISNAGEVTVTGVGSVTLHAVKPSDAQYTETAADITFTAQKAKLTVTAESKSKNAGDENPSFPLQYAGFVKGEDAGVLNSLPTAACAADKQSAAGEYAIIVSGGEDDHYQFVYVNGILKVTNSVNPGGDSSSQKPESGSSSSDPSSVSSTEPSVSNHLVTVSGILKDAKGNPIANQRVEIHSTVQETTTDANGYFEFKNIEFGNHVLSVKDSAGNVIAQTLLSIQSGSSTSLNGTNIFVKDGENSVTINVKLDGTSLTVENIIVPKTGEDFPLPLIVSMLASSILAAAFMVMKKSKSGNR